MSDTRVEQFKADIAQLSGPDAVTARDTRLARGGAALMVLGTALGVVALILSNSTDVVLDQNDDIILAVVALSVVVVGAATFVRYSLAIFLRFWMARLVYEQRTQFDRIVPGGPLGLGSPSLDGEPRPVHHA